jgi:hypothetical protein
LTAFIFFHYLNKVLKQLASILLLLTLLLNWCAYPLIATWFENQSESRLAALLDEECMDTSDLISIKVQANLPYQYSQDYERIRGNVEINGVNYTYVKRRFYNDSLELLCIPNIERTNLRNLRTAYLKNTNNPETTPPLKKSNGSYLSKSLVQDFHIEELVSFFYDNGSLSIKQYPGRNDWTSYDHLKRIDQPPETDRS